MTEFLRPRLIGERFQNGGIPLDMLDDLTALGEMIVEVAKWRFLEAHPDRERSPRGFSNRVSFNLVGVETGSAIPVIEIQPLPPQLPGMPSEYQHYFTEAHDAIVAAVAAAERDEAPETHIPYRYLGFFDRLGRRLREGESIEFPDTKGGHSARLTRESRRKLLIASRMDATTKEVDLWGYIPEADQDRMSFELQLRDGRKVKCPIHEVFRESIIDVFNKYAERGKVLIRGIGKYDQQDRLVDLVTVEDITVLDALDVSSRLDDLRDLEDGWLGEESKAPRAESLDWLSEVFDRQYPDYLPLPYIYPIIDGRIQAEWSLGPNEVSLEIDLTDHSAEWHCLTLDTGMTDERQLSLDVGDSWKWIAEEIRRLEPTNQ